MAEICGSCKFLASPIPRFRDKVSLPLRKSPALLARANEARRREQVRSREEEAIASGSSFAPLDGPPRHFEWCLRKSVVAEGRYFLRPEQRDESCALYIPKSPDEVRLSPTDSSRGEPGMSRT